MADTTTEYFARGCSVVASEGGSVHPIAECAGERTAKAIAARLTAHDALVKALTKAAQDLEDYGHFGLADEARAALTLARNGGE